MTIKEIKGYSLVDKAFIEELNSTAYYLKHNKTKAEILYLENDEDIKTFGIAFRTPPEDSTGVAHIVEHCVLSGSRKYKTKEPFMDLVNSSMQTFLNAMTFPDKTIYPVATRNEKDFFNLMDVYLDAVFYPAIYEVKEIFEQEGWHLELEDESGDIKYNGVVYNEMRGAYSDADAQVQELLSQRLHPDSTYAHDSGGNPHEITNLTYEDFLDFHKRYYHPSNSYVFLNGNMDIEKVLSYLDQDYFSNFPYQDPKSEIIMNKDFEEVLEAEDVYSIGKEDPTEDKSYYAYGVSLGLSTNPRDDFMRSILTDIIIDSDSSILRDKLIDSGIGEDYYSITSSSLPLDFFIVAKGTSGDDLDKFVSIIDEGLKEAVENKVDKNLLDATLNSFEFSLKELGIHKGVLLGISALKGWLYGTSPIESLTFKNLLEDLKRDLDKGIVEDYIKEKFLDNKQKIHLVVRPQPGLFLEKDERADEKLKDFKEALSPEEIQALVENTRSLFDYQLQEDSKEDKDTIPRLGLEDISPGVKRINTKTEEKDFTSIYVDEFTNDIFYMNLSFNLKNLTTEELGYGGIVLDLLGSLDTENYSYKDLSNEIDINTGGIKFSVSAFEDSKSDDYQVLATSSGRAVPEKIDDFLGLLEEIILRTKFQDKKRIKDLLIMNKGDLESNIEQSGHSVISSEINSMMNDSSDILNKVAGRKFLFFLKDLLENFDERADEVLEKLRVVYKKLFNRDLILVVSGEEPWYDMAKDFTRDLLPKLSEFEENLDYSRDEIKSLALKSSSNVAYVSDGFNYKNYGYENSGTLRVLSRILSGDYLHTQIRAKGGAYGSGISINNKGNVTTYSYRDPNLDKTFSVYDNIPKYLEELKLSKEDLTNYIISTMNQFDPPITPSQYTSIALARHFTKMTEEDLEKMKKEAIETKPEDIRAYKDMFVKAKDSKFYGVLGSRELIEKSERTYQVVEDMNK